VQRILHKMEPPQFSHKSIPYLMVMPQFYEFSSFVYSFAHLYDFMSISQKLVKFELEVHDSLLLIFKNI
jgi:hypothetical protein